MAKKNDTFNLPKKFYHLFELLSNDEFTALMKALMYKDDTKLTTPMTISFYNTIIVDLNNIDEIIDWVLKNAQDI